MQIRWTVGTKIFLSSAVGLLLTISISVVSLTAISGLGERLHKTIRLSAYKQVLAGNVLFELATMWSFHRGTLSRTYMKDFESVHKYNDSFMESYAHASQDLRELLPMLVIPEARELTGTLITEVDELAKVNEDMYRFCLAGQMDAARALDTDQFRPAASAAQGKAKRLIVIQAGVMADDDKAATSAVSESWWIAASLLLLALGANVVGMVIVRRMNAQLRQNVSTLSDGAAFVASAAGQVSSSSRSLAEGASTQAASLEETSASSEEVNAVARRNIDSAQSTSGIVGKSQERAVEANHQLDQMVTAMDEINQSSVKISKIIKVIDEIAFQTNILALNAAVEAARAGEAGMGFAVVADEVRSLAQRCAQAAKDTAELIEESLKSSSGGKQKVGLVAEAVRALTSDSGGIRILVDEISAGSEEQARGMKLIAGSLSRMEQTTQSTASAAEQGAAAAAELETQSDALKNVVRQLSTLINGADADTAHHVSSQMKAQMTAHTTARSHSFAKTAQPAAARFQTTRKVSGQTAAPKVAAVVSVKSTFEPGQYEYASGKPGSAEARKAFPLEEDFKEF